MSIHIRSFAAAPLLLTACSLSLDPNLVRDGSVADDDGGSVGVIDDGGVGDGETGDGSLDHDGDSSIARGDGDGSVVPPPPDTGTTPPCAGDADCGPTEYCSVDRGGQCLARCDDAAGCVALQTRPSPLISDDDHVYWADNSGLTQNGAASPNPQAHLMAWDASGAPFVVCTGSNYLQPLFTADGALYFLEGTTLRSAPVAAGSTSVQVATNVTRAWASDTSIYWSALRVGKQELWRVSRSGGTPTRLHSAEHYGFAGGDESFAYHWEPRSGDAGSVLVSENLPSFDTRRELMVSPFAEPGNFLGVIPKGDQLFVESAEYPNVPARIDLPTLDITYTRGAVFDSRFEPFELSGSWIYAAGTFMDPVGSETIWYVVRRFPEADPMRYEELLRVRFFGGSATFTVHGSLLVYANDGHLFTKPITP